VVNASITNAIFYFPYIGRSQCTEMLQWRCCNNGSDRFSCSNAALSMISLWVSAT